MNFRKEDNPALILIDIQKGFDDIEYWGGNRNNINAEKNAGQILQFWRNNGLPVIHIKHCSNNPKSRLHEQNPGNQFKEIVSPLESEPVVRKFVNSAFIGTNLKEILDNANIKKVVIVGLTTDHCVSTTTRMAGNYGYETYIVSDATATFDKKGFDGKNYPAELLHETALVSLHNEFATVVNTNELLSLLK